MGETSPLNKFMVWVPWVQVTVVIVDSEFLYIDIMFSNVPTSTYVTEAVAAPRQENAVYDTLDYSCIYFPSKVFFCLAVKRLKVKSDKTPTTEATRLPFDRSQITGKQD